MTSILHFQQHGLRQKDSPVLVLVHGLFGSCDNLSVIRRHFESEYRVVSLDLPDHGQSPRTQQFDFKHYAELIIDTLKHLDINRANFVAHSLGAKVMMWAAYLQAEIIESLICLDMAPVAYEPRHHNVLNGLSMLDLSNIESRTEAQKQLSSYIKDVSTQSFLLKSLYQNNEGQWAWRFNFELLKRDYPILSDWTLQDKIVYEGDVLFVKGVNSDYIINDYQETILQQFPQASAKIVPAGHWLHAEKPQLVNTLITKHLRKI